MTGGDIPIKKRFVSPGQRDERRHGQTNFVLGAKRSRDGTLPGLCLFSRQRDDTGPRRGLPVHVHHEAFGVSTGLAVRVSNRVMNAVSTASQHAKHLTKQHAKHGWLAPAKHRG